MKGVNVGYIKKSILTYINSLRMKMLKLIATELVTFNCPGMMQNLEIVNHKIPKFPLLIS